MSNALSLNPETYVEGGGFEGPLTLISARFVDDYDFNGKAKPQTGLKVTLVGESGKPFDKFYGIGKASQYAIIKDGKSLQPVGQTKGLNKNCKTAILISELMNCGFDTSELEDVSNLEGLHAEFVNKALKEFMGQEVKTQSGDDAQILVPVEIYLNPDDEETEDHSRFTASASKGKGTATGKKTSASNKKGSSKGKAKKGPSEEDLAEEAATIIMGVLADNDGSIPKSKLTSAVIKAIGNDNDNKAALVKLALSNDFLGGREEFSLEDGEVTLA